MTSQREKQPVISMKGREIVQVGIVVADAAKTARRYASLLGIGPWLFVDIAPRDMILHGKSLRDGASCVRVALAQFGNLEIELLQPLYGPSTHMAFFEQQGEGIHHFSFGPLDDHDRIVSALRAKGIGIEMQGLMNGAGTFSYMATQRELGTIIEAVRPAPPGEPLTLAPWGHYVPPGPGFVDTQGKKIAQIGIVVEDVDAAARNYWELLGIGPWTLIDFEPPHVSGAVFHGIPVIHPDFCVKAALADHGNVQIELLQPVSGPGTHMEFLKRRGQGIHHLSFGLVDDHDDCVARLESQGIEIEMTGLLGGFAVFTYMASQEQLGTIYEFVKNVPGTPTALAPHGVYPE